VDLARLNWWGSVQHRHGDEWAEMEDRTPAHRHDDPEREWGEGRVYYCAQCDEEVRVQLRVDPRP
jgi:hypothetical protein